LAIGGIYAIGISQEGASLSNRAETQHPEHKVADPRARLIKGGGVLAGIPIKEACRPDTGKL
jgi:hypothetical protein